MREDVINLLYTPLDTPPQPPYSISELKDWLIETYNKQNDNTISVMDPDIRITKEEKKIKDQYPWRLTLIYKNVDNSHHGWINMFDEKFPELADWILTFLGTTKEEIGFVIILPIREGHSNQGFWHVDPEKVLGPRFYLEHEDLENNKLLMRRTKEPNLETQKYIPPLDVDKISKDPTIECKIVHNKQSFVVNNARAIHSTWTGNPSSTRIAVIITPRDDSVETFYNKVNRLAIHSAKKYPEYTVWWE